MTKSSFCYTAIVLLVITIPACTIGPSSAEGESENNADMVRLLAETADKENVFANSWAVNTRMARFDSVISAGGRKLDMATARYNKAICLLQLGREEDAIPLLENMLGDESINDPMYARILRRDLAIACLRLGERTNCIRQHSGESCVFPLRGAGVHLDKTGSAKAIEHLEWLLRFNPNDLESRWLLNIAFMTTGNYPGGVPADLLIAGLDRDSSASAVKPFTDLAIATGLNGKSQAGGAIIDDFNNDGYPDIVTSSWDLDEHLFFARNNGDGTFTDVSDSSGLQAFSGGLHMMQTDYNNDGFKDIFVLRGGWKGYFGKEPNSLLRNNGDGTFTDVTRQAGLLSFYPTQTATWNDFNNDGWLDLFIGNESGGDGDPHPCEFYINNRNGTFTNASVEAGLNFFAFVKGVTSGDYDNDGWPDIFVSTLDGKKMLLHNEGVQNGMVRFKDNTDAAGLGHFLIRTFPTWFFDYDNDGWLDILVCGYEFNRSLASYTALESMHLPVEQSGKVFLFHNLQNGRFEDVSATAGTDRIAFAMGSNFGDIDNDGWLDFYLGTGNPQYQSLVPNKFFRNLGGKGFADLTSSARLGNLQKGHGVAFCDLDNDGDQDIYIKMGGAYKGDAYQASLYLNPGQNTNRWIDLQLAGVRSNKAAIGAKIRVSFTDDGLRRSVYREVSSGGSFGANPLLQHIGIGQATTVDSVEITWPASGTKQVLTRVPAGDYLLVTEGEPAVKHRRLNKLDFTGRGVGLLRCAPAKR